MPMRLNLLLQLLLAHWIRSWSVMPRAVALIILRMSFWITEPQRLISRYLRTQARTPRLCENKPFFRNQPQPQAVLALPIILLLKLQMYRHYRSMLGMTKQASGTVNQLLLFLVVILDLQRIKDLCYLMIQSS